MTKVQQWKPEHGVDREQTITRNQYYAGRLPSTHTFERNPEAPRQCVHCGRFKSVHPLTEEA